MFYGLGWWRRRRRAPSSPTRTSAPTGNHYRQSRHSNQREQSSSGSMDERETQLGALESDQHGLLSPALANVGGCNGVAAPIGVGQRNLFHAAQIGSTSYVERLTIHEGCAQARTIGRNDRALHKTCSRDCPRTARGCDVPYCERQTIEMNYGKPGIGERKNLL